ncbi:MAG TPA: hypothetical protein VGF40_08260, partial [Thermoanaerobaculia bacterium]
MTRKNDVKWRSSVYGVGAMAVLTALSSLPSQDAPAPAVRPTTLLTKAPAPVEPAPIPEAGPEELPSAAIRSLGESDRSLLAAELESWVTRHPRQLVDVIADLAEAEPLPLPATYLLSIAWSETRGKVLAVSPAGAAGLAQATPAAYLSEGFAGRLYVTDQYLIGTRAYIMKKPLGDAMTIVEPLLKKNTPARRAEARKLLAHAMHLRQEGMQELEALRPVANEIFYQRIARADDHNLATLERLAVLLDKGAPHAATKRFYDRARRDYKYLMTLQQTNWKRYETQLTNERDAMLRAKFGQSAAKVIEERPYEAGEYLGEALDARFSPTQMAKFLSAHLATKQKEALALGVPEEKLDEWTAALYNGGSVNVRRMKAGLIDSLRETEKYMKR